jgi:hypothetical protein
MDVEAVKHEGVGGVLAEAREDVDNDLNEDGAQIRSAEESLQVLEPPPIGDDIIGGEDLLEDVTKVRILLVQGNPSNRAEVVEPVARTVALVVVRIALGVRVTAPPCSASQRHHDARLAAP